MIHLPYNHNYWCIYLLFLFNYREITGMSVGNIKFTVGNIKLTSNLTVFPLLSVAGTSCYIMHWSHFSFRKFRLSRLRTLAACFRQQNGNSLMEGSY
jgi:hypothetical protein